VRTILHPVLLVAAGCSLSAVAAAPALAKTCPSGQFLQVSKGKCISKDSARYLGIAGRGEHAAKPTAKAKREKAGESTVARTAPDEPAGKAADRKRDGQAETTLASAAPAMATQSLGYAAAPTEQLTVRRNIAPFGALQFGGFK